MQKTALEELATRLAIRLQEQEQLSTLLTQYQTELQTLGQMLGCTDQQAPTQRLQEVLEQLSKDQKQVGNLLQENKNLQTQLTAQHPVQAKPGEELVREDPFAPPVDQITSQFYSPSEAAEVTVPSNFLS